MISGSERSGVSSVLSRSFRSSKGAEGEQVKMARSCSDRVNHIQLHFDEIYGYRTGDSAVDKLYRRICSRLQYDLLINRSLRSLFFQSSIDAGFKNHGFLLSSFVAPTKRETV